VPAQPVDATLSSHPACIENKSQNRSLGFDQQERRPGYVLVERSDTDDSPVEASLSLCTGRCCIDVNNLGQQMMRREIA
jgi:hypothetical protein